jgi:hypothetical protein
VVGTRNANKRCDEHGDRAAHLGAEASDAFQCSDILNHGFHGAPANY